MASPLETFNPKVERFNAAMKSAIWTLFSTMSAGLLALGFSINDEPAGLALLLVAVLVGVFPLARHGYNMRHKDRLDVDELPDSSAQLLSDMADASNRLRSFASEAKSGQVKTHLTQLADVADAEVRHSYRQLNNQSSLSSSQLGASVAETAVWLKELETAAHNLALSQHLSSGTGLAVGHGASPQSSSRAAMLKTLVERTNELETELDSLS